MKCPKCNCDALYVTDVLSAHDTKIFRRRRCNVCGFGFTTVECSEDEYIRTVSEALGKVMENCSEDFKRGYTYAYNQKHRRR